jgi:hypothetical protein
MFVSFHGIGEETSSREYIFISSFTLFANHLCYCCCLLFVWGPCSNITTLLSTIIVYQYKGQYEHNSMRSKAFSYLLCILMIVHPLILLNFLGTCLRLCDGLMAYTIVLVSGARLDIWLAASLHLWCSSIDGFAILQAMQGPLFQLMLQLKIKVRDLYMNIGCSCIHVIYPVVAFYVVLLPFVLFL